ncbi:MAG: membrane protein insertion efficiency factor YidD [Candidatus Eremiobacteraeota bacterium]|nr:membrane protein insertion efficiency factor YidD [Candidatus Eremiobacteraeota bacterium]
MIARRTALGALRLYKVLVSPLLPPACRFRPTCSEYAAEAIEKHGLLRGGTLAMHRLARCGPWCPGGYDPVPPRPTLIRKAP